MQVYAQEAIYDDPWSYCDTRYKIAGQWYGECPCASSLSATLLSPMNPFRESRSLGILIYFQYGNEWERDCELS
jgi:hypothetical protein